MQGVLLGLALTASLAVPASAEGISAASGFSSLSAFGASGSGDLRVLKGRPAGHRGDGFGAHRRHIHVGDGGFDGGPWGWGYYDGDYDANRSFDPDKWNDWWHDRPDRAYPRWMSRNQNCARPWYSGDVLTC
jgi:hypothetical protein